MVKLETNVNFRQDLLVSYLSQLASLGNREEFDKYYQSIEPYLQEVVNNSNDLELLSKVRDIISYKAKAIEINM